MDNTKTDDYYIQRIRKDLELIVLHMENIDLEELNDNEILLDSMLFRMIQLSENAKKLSEKYKIRHDAIPWIPRKLTLEYFDIDTAVRLRI